MKTGHVPLFVAGLLVVSTYGCGAQPATSLPDTGGAASLSVPDGIDPAHPNVERTSEMVNFDGVDTIRVELGQAQVSIEQDHAGIVASLKVTKLITRPGLSAEQFKQLLSATKIVAERSFVDSTRLDVTAELAEDLQESEAMFEVRLTIPQSANVEIFLERGQVTVTNMTGNVEIETSEGEINIEQIIGNVVARTSNNSIRGFDIVGDLEARTENGDVELRLIPTMGARIAASTENGSIRIAVTQSTSAALSLTSEGGKITANLSGFAVSNVVSTEGLFNAVLNGGAGRIEAETIGGDIEFSGYGQ